MGITDANNGPTTRKGRRPWKKVAFSAKAVPPEPPPRADRFAGRPGRPPTLVLGGSLGFAHALLQALGAAVTAAIQFFLALDLLVSHVFPPDGASPDNVSSPFTLFSEQSPALQPAARPLHALQTKKLENYFFSLQRRPKRLGFP